MIKIDRSGVVVPECLRVDVDSAGKRESILARAHFEKLAAAGGEGNSVVAADGSLQHVGSNAEGREVRFKFKAYKGAKKSLRTLFRNKCGYCEIAYGGAPSDVEHFRPKGRIDYVLGDREMSYPNGYYWLAADWNNLIYSCQHCNRTEWHNHQDYPGGPIVKRASGKGNLFPLSDENGRLKPLQDAADEEPYRLLLNPCQDEPSAHLRFHDNGFVTAAQSDNGSSLRGRTSINVYGLDRVDLRDRRKAVASQLLFIVARLNDDLVDWTETTSERSRRNAKEAISHIQRTFLGPECPFLGMSRTIFGEKVDRRRLALLESHPP